MWYRLGRVVTRSIATTDNVSNFLASVDANVCGILLAKRAVLMARKLDNTAHTDPAVFQYLYVDIESSCNIAFFFIKKIFLTTGTKVFGKSCRGVVSVTKTIAKSSIFPQI